MLRSKQLLFLQDVERPRAGNFSTQGNACFATVFGSALLLYKAVWWLQQHETISKTIWSGFRSHHNCLGCVFFQNAEGGVRSIVACSMCACYNGNNMMKMNVCVYSRWLFQMVPLYIHGKENKMAVRTSVKAFPSAKISSLVWGKKMLRNAIQIVKWNECKMLSLRSFMHVQPKLFMSCRSTGSDPDLWRLCWCRANRLLIAEMWLFQGFNVT